MPTDRQRWDPERYGRWAAYVPELGRDLIGLLDPRPCERVLDLGCGNGTLTTQIAACGCSVLGIDRDAGFVEVTRRRGLSALQTDARHLVGPQLAAASFDGVFSNAVLHWIPEAGAVIANVGRLLRDGGRFVGELGGAGNIATVRQALHQVLGRHGINAASRDPWFFPTAETYRHLLETHGFQVYEIQLFPRPTPLPGHLSQWLDTFAATFLDGLDSATRQAVVDEVSDQAASQLCNGDGLWMVDYVRLRFLAIKSGRQVRVSPG